MLHMFNNTAMKRRKTYCFFSKFFHSPLPDSWVSRSTAKAEGVWPCETYKNLKTIRSFDLARIITNNKGFEKNTGILIWFHFLGTFECTMWATPEVIALCSWLCFVGKYFDWNIVPLLGHTCVWCQDLSSWTSYYIWFHIDVFLVL